MKDRNCQFFKEPVDYITLNLPDYPEIVKKPMDLGTVMLKLTSKRYKEFKEFVDDVNLIFANCMAYNQVDYPNLPIRQMCKAASAKFVKLVKGLKPDLFLKVYPQPASLVSVKVAAEKHHLSKTQAEPGQKLFIPSRKLKKLLEKLLKDPDAKMHLTGETPLSFSLYSAVTISSIADPLNFTDVLSKLSTRRYVKLADFVRDVLKVFGDNITALSHELSSPNHKVDVGKLQHFRVTCIKLRDMFNSSIKYAENELIQKHAASIFHNQSLYEKDKIQIGYDAPVVMSKTSVSANKDISVPPIGTCELVLIFFS